MGLFQRTRETLPRIHGRNWVRISRVRISNSCWRTTASSRRLGKIGAIEAKFNNETGNIAFRADFPNPDGLLRHGQTGTVLINRVLKDAIVIPQRATFEILDKRYVYVVGKDDVVHQREIVIQHELDDIFVIEKGLDVNDKIVLEGIRQVRDGEKVEYEFRHPEEVHGRTRKTRQNSNHFTFVAEAVTQPLPGTETKQDISEPCSQKFLHRPALAIVISVIILFLGGLAINTLPISQFPSVAPPTRDGLGFLSRRQCQCPGRLGPDYLGAGHQRRTGHALHGLRRHQCR